MLTYGIPPGFRGGVHMKPPYAIGSVPSLSGHAVAYLGWRSLPRVRRHRASKPQGSSERVLPWQITMDQLIFASLSHIHYWYKVGMLKVPEKYQIVRSMTIRAIHFVEYGKIAIFPFLWSAMVEMLFRQLFGACTSCPLPPKPGFGV